MKVTKYDNFINSKLLEEIQKLAKNCISLKKSKFTNHEMWPEYVVKDSEQVLVWDIKNENENLFKKISDYIVLETGYKDVLCCYLYCWKQSSFIPWHTDAEHNAALTIYLNNFWDRDWGGYFMYYDNDDIKCIIPEENLAILQENNPLHSTTMTTPSSSDRITLQLFLNNKIENLKKSNTLI